MKPILKIESLKKYYGRQDNITRAIDGIDLNVMEGEFLGIMGASGSGKSTLLNCIATVIKPTGGTIELNGQNLSKLGGRKLAEYRGKEIGYLFQNFELVDNLTGRENIMLPISLHGGKAASEERMNKLIDYLEIGQIVDKFPSQMSGGEKQRIAAARAMILNPKIILADEPTGALDSKNAKLLMGKLEGLNSEDNATILLVTHDSNAASYCSRILFIQDGKIFHELRKEKETESRHDFYERIIKVMAQLGGGSANVL
ncbi:MAG: ABC transporter ATP-binding protein [Clostridiales bacterium]|nr:ABC transporter ATP-binding protein [Clostridiales bacterium]